MNVVYVLAQTLVPVWLAASVAVLFGTHPDWRSAWPATEGTLRALRAVYHEGRPVYPIIWAVAVAGYFSDGGDAGEWIAAALSGLSWFIKHDSDDDDRWRRRRERATARVKEIAGRLVVAPEPVPVSAR